MKLAVTPTELPEVLVLEPKVFHDHRGFLFESFNVLEFAQATGLKREFVQDNHSRSVHGVLRGLHYQIKHPQGKLVRVVAGEIFDVAVDIRLGSATFGRWVGVNLSAENLRQMWVPEGFAHGFLVLSESADVLYKTTDYYHPELERCIRWDDATIGVAWPEVGVPLIMTETKVGVPLAMAEVF
ncbi:dTDP-4-dehydrorhamnose 3,5-epimerase [Cupriavidus sp. CV2]|uniref:dTDP-4-dehydrorhamnose 3,5-epimerase n=1 Tax=Cupriavidus ulmosensis TaxID=3065913 RepID=UPI00296A9D08|nr:dTDP-4-dehydrorhamnose 3,5-epimerase [Cupriavidus sp. CV2]MDW3681747.1 dTDP-4-dehydrorhamnose 3,5-epimerase [Cupriavidus sp. CV2]